MALADRAVSAAAVQSVESLQAARSQIAQKIEALGAVEPKDPAASQQRQAAIAQLRSIDVLYARFQTLLDERRQLKDEENRIAKEAEALETFGPTDAKPYSFLLLENLRAERDSLKDREAALKSNLKTAKKSLESGQENLDHTKQQAWTSNPLLAEATDSWALSSADLEEVRAKVAVALRQAEIENLELRLKNAQSRQEFVKDKLKAVERDVKFTSQDRDKQLGQLAAAEARLRDKRREAESALQEIETNRPAAQTGSSSPPAGAPVTTPSATAAALEMAATAAQRQIVLLDQRIDALGTLRTIWKRRYQFANGEADSARLSQWIDEIDDFNKELADICKSCEYRSEAPNAGVAAAPAIVPAHSDQPDDAKLAQGRAERQVSALRELSADTLAELKATQQSLDRFHDELKARLPKAKSNWLTGPLALAWNFEIAGEDDEAVTLGTLLILLAYLLAGVAVAMVISRIIRGRLLTRLGIHHGAADALKSILFYLLCIVFGFIAFRALNVPLAAFAFLGGAAAIAVGFGSQDIMNNFMSGIILLTEQPIRVGDVVDIGGVEGVVLHIGMRSTRLQTQTNHELIVPNKTLIDEQVTNLTLSNNLVQTSVAVTLERSIKIQQAKHDILKLVFAHPMVIKSMRPLVLVKEIDNYWLIFQVHFWVQYTSYLECAAIQSDILEVIGDKYRPLADDEKPAEPTTNETDASEGSPENATPNIASAPDQAAALAAMQKMGSAVISKQLKRLGAAKVRG